MRSPSFRPLATFLRGACGLALLLAVPAPAAALDRASYALEILVDGVPLQEHVARGKRYVEALEGREYAIRLTNRTAERIAVALSVDGLNTIDAKSTTAGEAAKWIVGPHRSITLEGWQTGQSTARRFFFTTEEKSYGAWLGDTRNLGIVSAAVFRERRPTPIYRKESTRRGRSDGEQGGRGAPAPSSPSAKKGRARESEGTRSRALADAAPQPSDDYAATGIGRKIDHRVRRIDFETEPSPAAVMELRYEFHDALVRLGIRPRQHSHFEDPLARRERSRGFEPLEFAPDPFDRSR